MTVRANTFTTEDFASIVAKFPDKEKVFSGELTKWDFDENSVMYAVSVSLIYELRQKADSNQDALKNMLNFMLNSFVGPSSDELLMVSIITLDRHGIHVDDVEDFENEKRFRKVLDKTRNRH